MESLFVQTINWIGTHATDPKLIFAMGFIFVCSFLFLMREFLAWYLKVGQLKSQIYQLSQEVKNLRQMMENSKKIHPPAGPDLRDVSMSLGNKKKPQDFPLSH